MAIELKPKNIQRRLNEIDPLLTRMDNDEKLYFLDPYIMKDFTKNERIPKIVNLTMNDPAVYAFRTIAYLQGASPNIKVDSDDKNMTDKAREYIQSFCRDYLRTVDEKIGLWGIAGLHAYACEQACIRGRNAAYVVNYLKTEGKEKIPTVDCRPLDARYTYYQRSMTGFLWSAHATRRAVEELPDEKKAGIDEDVAGVDVLDCHTANKNTLFMKVGSATTVEDATELKTKKTPYDYVPLVYEIVPAGSMLSGEYAIPHKGESIFALNRDLYPKLNELATVLENLTMASFFGARQYASEAGEQKETEALPFGLGIVVSIEKGGGYTLIPVADIRNATRLLYSMIETRLQRGSLPAIDYGNLTFPLSAVAIARLTEGKDQIFIPRLSNIASYYVGILKMAIKQFIAMGLPVMLGTDGHRREYDPSQLQGEYALVVQYDQTSREQRLADITEAQALRGILSDDTIRRDTLHVNNPDEEEAKLSDEEMKRLDPAYALYKRIQNLISLGYYGKKGVPTEIALRTLEKMLRQRMIQTSLEVPSKETLNRQETPERIMPLTEGGGAGQRSPKSEERQEEEYGQMGEELERRAETGREGRREPAMVGAGQAQQP